MTSEAKTPRNVVVKIGGSTLGNHDTTLQDVVTLERAGRPPIVVHGGGAIITQWLEKQGVQTRFVRGLRVTDSQSLEVVTAVLAGLVNKDLVAGLLGLGGRAVGLSGIDGGIIEGRLRDPELGFVGDACSVNLGPIHALLTAGYTPVLSTLGYNPSAAGGEGPATLNLNADTVAGEVAAAMNADCLVFLTDVPGVQDKDGSLLPHLTADEASELIESGTASGGMIPKLQACVRAARAGTRSWIVDGRVEHILLTALTGRPAGTIVD